MLAVLLLGCAQSAVIGGGSAAVIYNGILYVGSEKGDLMAINSETGVRSWTVAVLQSAPRNALGCTATARAAAIYGTPAVAGDMVYVGGYDGRLRIYSNGLEKARYPAEETASVGNIVGGPVLGRGNVYFGTSKGEVFALDAVSLAKKWQFSADGKVWASPVLVDDTIYISSMDDYLYALNADTGAEIWHFAAGGAINSPPVIAAGTAYFGAFDRYFYAVNTSTGQLAWRSQAQAKRWFWAKPLVVGNAVFAGDMDGMVYVFDVATGAVLANSNLGAPLVAAPVLSGDSVIFASQTGQLWALDTARYQPSEFGASITGKVNAPLALSNDVIYIHSQNPETLYAVRASTGVSILSIPLGK